MVLLRKLRFAGSENSDQVLPGNSDHLPVARPGQKIVGDSASGEGKNDRHAETPRDSGAPAAGHTWAEVAALSGVSIGTARRVAVQCRLFPTDGRSQILHT